MISHRNNSIEALRFFMICIICLWHLWGTTYFLQNGHPALEFFFILSGYFLYISYIRHPQIGVLDYTLSKAKKFFVPLTLSNFALMLLDRKQYILCSSKDITPDGILSKYYIHIHEFLFAQCIGLSDTAPINYTLWYISILLFGGGLLYALIKCYPQKSTSLLIPILYLIGINLYFGDLNHKTIHFIGNSYVTLMFVRGLTEMGTGILLACLIQQKRSFFNRRTRFFDFLSIFSLFGFGLLIVAHNNYEYLTLIFIPLILISCFTDGSMLQTVFKSDIWRKLGGISMYMYFIHLSVASVFFICNSWLDNLSKSIISSIFLFVVIVCAKMLKHLSITINRKIGF